MKKTSATLAALFSVFHLVHGAVLPPGATVAGKTAGEWMADVWKWVYSQSTNASAILDCTGQFATNGQPAGLVFFCPHNNGLRQETCERTFTVPENKYLLVPIAPITIDNINTEPPYTAEGQRLTLNDYIAENTANLYVEVDSQALPKPAHYRASSPVFSVHFRTADNSLSVSYGVPVIGLVEPLIADGFWFFLEPLPVGSHVIKSGGDIGFFHHSYIFRIAVTPVPARQWIEDLLAVTDEIGPDRGRRVLRNHLQRAKSLLASGNKAAALLELQTFKASVEKHVRPSNAATASQLIWAAEKTISKIKSPR